MATMKTIAMLAHELGLPAGELYIVQSALVKHLLNTVLITPAANELRTILGLELHTREDLLGMVSLTCHEAMALRHGTILHHYAKRNADKTPLRVRVSGKCKTWVRRPSDFQLPVKHGLRDCGYITHESCNEWYVA